MFKLRSDNLLIKTIMMMMMMMMQVVTLRTHHTRCACVPREWLFLRLLLQDTVTLP